MSQPSELKLAQSCRSKNGIVLLTLRFQSNSLEKIVCTKITTEIGCKLENC